MTDASGQERLQGPTWEELAAEVQLLRARLAVLEAGAPAPDAPSRKEGAIRFAQSAMTALRKSDERFYTCVEHMLDCFAIFSAVRDAAGHIVDFHFDYVNKAGCEFHRVSLDEHIGRTLLDIIPRAHAEAGLFDRYRHVVETGEPLELEMPDYLEDAAGNRTRRDLEIRAWKLEDGFAVVWRDVSMRKAHQDLVERERVFFRAILDVDPSLVFVKDADGRFVIANDAMGKLYALTPSELRSRMNIDLLTNKRDNEHYARIDQEVLRTGATLRVSETHACADGRILSLLTTKAPIAMPNGETGVVGIAQDVTELKAREAELRKAKEEAERVNAAQEKFLAQLSHELRTPLTPAITAAEILVEDRTLPGPAREFASMIHRNLQLQARLIDDLLDTTRIKGGKVALRLAPTDLHVAIEDVVQICRDDIQTRKQELTLDLAATQHRLMVDPARLRQMLWNLLKNAVKFTPTGGQLHIRTANPEPGRVRIEVTDSGIGIAPEILPTLFAPFEQGAADITRRFGGLGLGLSITRGLAELHGGSLSASSAGVGKGATFRLDLRLGDPHAIAANTPEQAGSKRVSGRILLVEDHEDTARALSIVLHRWGHTVVAVSTVADALRHAESETFDLLFADIQLPDGTGLDLMERLAMHQSLPAIVMSGAGMKSDVEESTRRGALAHLTKPIRVEVLDALLSKILSTRT